MLKNKTELMIQLTYNCNLNCVHCAYGDIRNSPTLTLKQIKEFLDRHNSKLIKLSGGEPTISSIFFDAVKLCKETGAKVVSFTNGLTEPKIDPDYYWVSLYGNEKTHNVEYLNSPVFSRPQMQELKEISERIGSRYKSPNSFHMARLMKY